MQYSKAKGYLTTAIQLLEQRLNTNLKPEEIAEAFYISPRQFYRDFYSFTGHSVHEYLRKRRLSKALSALRYTDRTPTDIALDCGYSSHSAMCAAIKNILGVTPLAYRTMQEEYYFPPFLSGPPHRQVEMMSCHIPQTIGLSYYNSSLKSLESGAVEQLLQMLKGYTGSLFGFNLPQKGSQFGYELRLPYSPELISMILSSGYRLPALYPAHQATFAMIKTPFDQTQIQRAWNDLYSRWLPSSMFEASQEPYFEQYHVKSGQIKSLTLHLPVTRKKGLAKLKMLEWPEKLFLTATAQGQNAQTIAAESLTSFLAGRSPHLFTGERELFLQKRGQICTCGICVTSPLHLPGGNIFDYITLPGGTYAVLEGNSTVGYGTACSLLEQWFLDHDLPKAGDVFTLYQLSVPSHCLTAAKLAEF